VNRRRELEPAALTRDVRGVPAGTHVTILEVLDIGYLVEAFDQAGERSTLSSPRMTTSATAKRAKRARPVNVWPQSQLANT
jgi:hypothetical protein